MVYVDEVKYWDNTKRISSLMKSSVLTFLVNNQPAFKAKALISVTNVISSKQVEMHWTAIRKPYWKIHFVQTEKFCSHWREKKSFLWLTLKNLHQIHQKSNSLVFFVCLHNGKPKDKLILVITSDWVLTQSSSSSFSFIWIKKSNIFHLSVCFFRSKTLKTF